MVASHFFHGCRFFLFFFSSFLCFFYLQGSKVSGVSFRIGVGLVWFGMVLEFGGFLTRRERGGRGMVHMGPRPSFFFFFSFPFFFSFFPLRNNSCFEQYSLGPPPRKASPLDGKSNAMR